VSAINDLEKRDLRVTSQVNILGAIGDELHQTTSSHFLYPQNTK
jgi:hypothetical protein